jgi:hypothetical protein
MIELLLGGALALALLAIWVLFPQLLVRPQRISPIKYEASIHEILSGEECERIAEGVLALQEHWRKVPVPFNIKVLYTLGATKYSQRKKDYQERADLLNGVMREQFSWFYDRLLEYFQRELGKPVKLTEDGGVPGFHIVIPHPVFKYPVGSLHYDFVQKPDWYGHQVDDAFSFTLPLQLPSAGAGLFMWDKKGAQVFSGWALAKALLFRGVQCFRPKTRIDYKEGWIVCHDGQHYHMMTPSTIQDGEHRITAQGHGLLIDGEWHLYF